MASSAPLGSATMAALLVMSLCRPGAAETPTPLANWQYRAYDPGGGLRSAGFGASLVYFLSDHWLLNGAVSCERLIGEAADSPIVETKDQFTANPLLDYMF